MSEPLQCRHISELEWEVFALTNGHAGNLHDTVRLTFRQQQRPRKNWKQEPRVPPPTLRAHGFNLDSTEIIRLQQDTIEHLRAKLDQSQNLCQSLTALLTEAHKDNQQLQRELLEHLVFHVPDVQKPSSEKQVKVSEFSDGVPHVSPNTVSSVPSQEVDQPSTPPMNPALGDTTASESMSTEVAQDEKPGSAPSQADILEKLTKIAYVRDKIPFKPTTVSSLEILLVRSEAVFPNQNNLDSCFVYKPVCGPKNATGNMRRWGTITARRNELVLARDDGMFYLGTYTSCEPATVLDDEGFWKLENEASNTKMGLLKLTAGVSREDDIPKELMLQYLSGKLKVAKIPLQKVGIDGKVASIVEAVESLPKV
ncbi:hypothetical protein B0H17DRAFT_1137708 [Mycena rosella]|uniref:Uncharacterized protein n=1 Tax=Mycena rosella TaxID=1033263 RepID=A0AAD7D875_MYCRO|nr:hypothetical protein B0H17DRAFT_1137708 [Mycena rosella]